MNTNKHNTYSNIKVIGRSVYIYIYIYNIYIYIYKTKKPF